MNRVLALLIPLLVLSACMMSEADEYEDLKKERSNFKIHKSISDGLSLDSLVTVWKIEDRFIGKESVDDDYFFEYTDKYLLDEESFDLLNESEQELVMRVSGMISKLLDDRYDEESLQADKEEFYFILEYGG